MHTIQFVFEFFPGDNRAREGSQFDFSFSPVKRLLFLPLVEITSPEIRCLLLGQPEFLSFVDSLVEQGFQLGQIVREVQREFNQIFPMAGLFLIHMMTGPFETIDRLRALFDKIVDEDAKVFDFIQDMQTVIVVAHDLT